jgi:hypothetical protein
MNPVALRRQSPLATFQFPFRHARDRFDGDRVAAFAAGERPTATAAHNRAIWRLTRFSTNKLVLSAAVRAIERVLE